MAMAADGRFVIAWDGNGPGDADGVFVAAVQGRRLARRGQFRVNTTTMGSQANPAVAMGVDGQVRRRLERLRAGRPGGGLLAGVFGRGKSSRQGNAGQHVHDPGQQNPSLAMADDGRLTVVWNSRFEDGSGWGVYGQQFDAQGQKIGGEFRVSGTSRGDQRDATVAMDAVGQPGGGLERLWHKAILRACLSAGSTPPRQ